MKTLLAILLILILSINLNAKKIIIHETFQYGAFTLVVKQECKGVKNLKHIERLYGDNWRWYGNMIQLQYESMYNKLDKFNITEDQLIDIMNIFFINACTDIGLNVRKIKTSIYINSKDSEKELEKHRKGSTVAVVLITGVMILF